MLKTEELYVSVSAICEACESAPAAFLCKADSASLCSACDAEIHSANPLARRHHRLPINQEPASWLLLNPPPPPPFNLPSTDTNTNNGVFLLGGDREDDDDDDDDYLNFVEFNTTTCGDGTNGFVDDDHRNYGGGCGEDSVVPIDHHHHNFESPKANSYTYNPFLTNNTGSVSSMEVGVVPESTTVSDMSISTARPVKGTIDLFSSAVAVQMPATQLSPMDREARVLRYREKKKMRKFEKTIRYASRKAYAETRPRIKGRFAKRTDVEVQLDRKFSNPLMVDTGYGIVPSF